MPDLNVLISHCRPVSRVAMKAKLNDACAFINRQRRVVNKLKRDLLVATGNKRFKQRRILKQIRVKLAKEKQDQILHDNKKVDRYVRLQTEMMKEAQAKKFKLPASLSEFSKIKALNKEGDELHSFEPPMVYDNDISLSDEEIAPNLPLGRN